MAIVEIGLGLKTPVLKVELMLNEPAAQLRSYLLTRRWCHAVARGGLRAIKPCTARVTIPGFDLKGHPLFIAIGQYARHHPASVTSGRELFRAELMVEICGRWG